MGKVKIPRKSTAMDMTAMTDVAFLLLTFFMLTSKFISKEAIVVAPPNSISEISIPQNNIFSILIDSTGKVFVGMDKQGDRKEWIEAMAEQYNVKLTDKEIYDFSLIASFGVPMQKLETYLSPAVTATDRDAPQWKLGVPYDSTDNQFKDWAKAARTINSQVTIVLKADKGTPYTTIKKVLGTLQDVRLNRINLITNLEAKPEILFKKK